jgi:hypothetical protein
MTRGALLLAAIAGAVLAIVLAACATSVADRDAACDNAYAEAMAVDPASDTVDVADGAIATCSSLEAWVAAARRFPDTTAGQDPVAFAASRCAAAPGIAGSPVCLGVPGTTTP